MTQTTVVANANICQHLNTAAQTMPTELAVAVQHAKQGRFDYQEIDFISLHQQSDMIAKGLLQFGITRGMKAVLMVTPSLEFFSLTFALFKAGIIPILVDPGMGINNLKQCFEESRPDVFIGIPKAHIARRMLGWGKGSVKHLINVGGSGLQRWLANAISLETIIEIGRNQAQPLKIALLERDEMAAILFTSGSTGTPKGVVYSHGMFEAQISALKHDYGITPGERDLATFPLFSLFGPALGMASIVPDMDASKPISANPANLFAAIDQYQCSNMFVNPALLERLGQAGEQTQHKLTSVKRVISAGAPATISSIKRFSQMLNPQVEVLNSYGATESLPISMIGSHALFATSELTDQGKGICVGKPIQSVSVDIIAVTDAAQPEWVKVNKLSANQIGEIVVSGPMVSQAYYQRQHATDLAKINDGDRVIHRMGDVGYIDDNGLLWMCGRKGHIVDATRGKQRLKRFYTLPCERVFNTHPQVKRSAIVGVNVNGDMVPVLCVELSKGVVCSTSKVLYQELMALAQQYPHTEGIGRFLIHPDFPVDVRHNAKIFREKLAIWAQKQWKE
ncbi:MULTISPECIES: olefin beta-lactone synthetase [Shewanella]|uniref:olefin beta-lactone synthetase n=1 Tax=Shewanella TaxID=22 RepID=UPI000C67B7A6|nr:MULTISPECIES: fatty acid CoA ligase family protein [Shewanella]NCQ46559.1 AMP-binding protein [Shewanella frigidimarina]NCO72544.1 AMP-binding protein [Shewanella vesiculosa]NCP38094.1 AMP-binding protein [Shewanella vesiculosa]NCP70400.1 AMP-binding protein [Shewanella vesiculosa]NCP75827.1 AMP-binding protein [Shewanella vesiculosa]